MVDSHRENAVRDRIEAGEVALGVLDNTYSPTLIEFYGDLGVDFVWLDFEHGGPSPWDATAMEDLLRAAEGTGTELLARIPTTEPELVRKALDAGVRNLFLSRVTGVEEVERAARAARFEYDGEPGDRGMANPRARRWGLAEDYVATEDEEVFFGVTVENREAVDAIDDIVAVPELDFVFAGPLDLSVSLGHPGEFDHPDVQEGIETVRSAAVDSDVALGGLGFGMDDVNEKAENGYQLLHVGSTTGALKPAVTGWLDDFEGDRSR
ncbi:HpcH/HpaI aldolase family protein [Halosimplex salinum]|uniref:HpcH/HpaI aldolase family protein n=1 Tax=Halosimplex salinum TaxID=1710538 RepID=UPI000F4953C2|nr:aldolase/citrate lyase family protein [Halosimplex salinum]